MANGKRPSKPMCVMQPPIFHHGFSYSHLPDTFDWLWWRLLSRKRHVVDLLSSSHKILTPVEVVLTGGRSFLIILDWTEEKNYLKLDV